MTFLVKHIFKFNYMKFSAIDIGTSKQISLVGEVVKKLNKSFVKKYPTKFL